MRPFELAAVDLEQLPSGGVVPQPVHHLAPRRAAELGRQRRELLFRLLLEMQAVAPQLRARRHERVLEVQPAAELLFTDGEGQRVGARLDVVAQRGTERRQRLERVPARRPEPLAERGLLLRHLPPYLRDELSAAAEHDERGIEFLFPMQSASHIYSPYR